MSQKSQSQAALGLVRNKLSLADLIRESWWSISRDLGRSVVSTLGSLLGCAAFVASLGLTGTASHQVSASFDARRATEVSVTANTTSVAPDEQDAGAAPTWYTPKAAEQVQRLAGVEHAGRVTTLKAVGTRRFFQMDSNTTPSDLYAVDGQSLSAMSPKVISGRAFDQGHVNRGDAVIMLSKPIADQLGIADPGTAIFIGDAGFTVIGIYSDVTRIEGAAAGVILPITSPELSALSSGQTPQLEIFVETRPGAAGQVSGQVPLAVSPAKPDAVTVAAPPDPKTLRQEIESSVTQLSLLVSLVTLVLGAISIGNTTAIGVVLRTPEIGLRRALGARRSDIFWQFIGETAGLGILGGVLGSLLGAVVTIGVSLMNGWVPVLDPVTLLIAIGAGLLAGLAAGTLPALRATRITPAHALSR